MKIAQINMVHFGSTGKIMFGIADTARALGHTVYTFSPRYYQRGHRTSYPDIRIIVISEAVLKICCICVCPRLQVSMVAFPSWEQAV